VSGTGWMFRASWPILDDSRTPSMLRVEACREVDRLAEEAGCRITGDLVWTVIEGHLIAQGPATPLAPQLDRRPRNYVAMHAAQIERLAGLHWTDSRIAAALGCSESAVAKVRYRNGIPPGVGCPTLSGVQQQRKGRAA
jgi:hypothetical protein